MTESSALIQRLRTIAAGETRTTVADPIDAWRDSGFAAGQLHEVYATEREDAASAAGFVVACLLRAGVARTFWTRTDTAERQGGRLHANGLVAFGLDPATVTLAVVEDEPALLKAAADASRCAGLGCVVLESWGAARLLDLTATRRLMLAAEASGACVVSLRIADPPSASAAATRWAVAAAPSRSLDANAPGLPSFAVELLRRRGGPAGQCWHVEWNPDERTFVTLAPLSGARLSVAADRATARDAAASVRRTG